MTILLEITLIHVGLTFFPSLGTPIPDLLTIISHLFYAQDLLGYGKIVSIFWTLCYEFQFYIVLVGLLVLTSYERSLIAQTQAVNITFAITGLAAFI
jgi:peptidoglycan/LPS O-acetylase OafA/YrhL